MFARLFTFRRFLIMAPVMAGLCVFSISGVAVAAETSDNQLEIVFLALEDKVPPALSNLDPFIANEGIPGAELAIDDNNTTGRFTGQSFILTVVEVRDRTSVISAYQRKRSEGRSFFVTRVPANILRQIAALPASADSLVFDISTSDDSLRTGRCDSRIFHIRPSRAMRTDALAQYMLKKRWRNWFLVIGPTEADRLYAKAVRRAARRFGMKVVTERAWETTHDARRTAQSEVSVLTQGDDYDVIVVADEQGLFGEYLSYRTWLPRPVIGTQGLVGTSWDRNHEQWGAVQLQNRFREKAHRWMTEQDYAAWLAIRVIGEAATRTARVDAQGLESYIRGEDFSVAGFKGKKLSFRPWSGQLRQPLLLASARSLVAVAPLEGFLHPGNELDTLGYDRMETGCPR